MNGGILLFKDKRVCLVSNNYILGTPWNCECSSQQLN